MRKITQKDLDDTKKSWEIDSLIEHMGFKEGEPISKGSTTIVVEIFRHLESDCAWMVVRDKNGQLWEYDFPQEYVYENLPRGKNDDPEKTN
jgi:hypothetical protein